MGSVRLFCLLLLVGGALIAVQLGVHLLLKRVRGSRERSSD